MRIDHIQLAMPAGGEEKARGFYGRLLEMSEVPKPKCLRSRGGCWFRSAEYEVHIGVDPDFHRQEKAHPAFAVADLDAFAERLSNAGCDVLWDHALPDIRRFYTSDPFGNRIEFLAEGGVPRDRAPEVARACGALLEGGRILMVQHARPGATYWTLPGGHVEPGETPERAVIREVREETGIAVEISRVLWDEPLPDGYHGKSGAVGRCFLVVAAEGSTPVLGSDPEERHLPEQDRLLRSVEWRRLDEMRDDQQVAEVMDVLGLR